MSGSPKYSRAELDERRRRQLEAERRRREEKDRVRRDKERARRIRAEQAQLRTRQADLARRADTQRQGAADTGEGQRHAALTRDLASLADRAAGAFDEAALTAVRAGLDRAEQEATALAVAVSAHLARRERTGALDELAAILGAEPARAELDPGGAAEVDTALRAAGRETGSGDTFPAVYKRLTATVEQHLGRARTQREELVRIRREAERAHGELAELLAEAATAGADLTDAATAATLLTDLTAAAARGDVADTDRLMALARTALADLTEAFDTWLDELACTEIILDAVRRALPAAGLQLEPDSVEPMGTGRILTARRASGDRIVLAVVPDGKGSARLVYEGEGHDFETRVTADGAEEQRCDLTAEILEQFQEALLPEGVVAGELSWKGKPELDPGRTAKHLPSQHGKERQ